MRKDIKKRIESVLQKRIKLISDDHQTYTGTPEQLMNELTEAITKDYLIIKPNKPA